MSEADSPLLEVRGLVKDYPGVRALDGVDLTVTRGQVHCLIGQNGAGKSTLMETILQGQKDIKAVYTHDDDMAMGVVQAIKAANREDEMFLTGAGGSKAAMDLIAEGGLYRATFLYNPSMSASAVSLAKLIAERKGLSELAEPEVPSYIELPATTVTKDNVAAVQSLGY